MKNLSAIILVLVIFSSCKKENLAQPITINQSLEFTVDSIPWIADNTIKANHNGDYLTIRGKNQNGGNIEIRVAGPLQKGTYLAEVRSYIIYEVDTYNNEIFHSFKIAQGYIEITKIDADIVEGIFDATLWNSNVSKRLKNGKFHVQLGAN